MMIAQKKKTNTVYYKIDTGNPWWSNSNGITSVTRSIVMHTSVLCDNSVEIVIS